MEKGILIVVGWFFFVSTTAYIWGAATTLASNSIKVKRVCDLCFRNIKEWNKVYHENQKSKPTPIKKEEQDG